MVWGGLVYAVAMLFADKWWVLEALSNGRMLVLAVVLLGAALSLIAFAPLRMVSGLVVAAWLGWPALPYYGIGKQAIYGSGEREPSIGAPPATISVLCFNIGRENIPLPGLVTKLESTPRNELPDLILLIEARTAGYRDHFNALREVYPHHIAVPRDDNFGMWLMSKHPIKKQRSISRNDLPLIGEIPLIDADISINGQTVRVFGAHPMPPISEEAAASRSHYLSLIGTRIAENSSPTILLGDLNCTTWSPQFDKLDKLRPAAYGYGLQLTWKPFAAVPLLGLPIDHILLSRDLRCEDFSIGSAAGSDHRPLNATISLPAAK